MCRTVTKLIDMFVYSAVGIAAPALEEEVAADLPSDELTPEQVTLFFFFLENF